MKFAVVFLTTVYFCFFFRRLKRREGEIGSFIKWKALLLGVLTIRHIKSLFHWSNIIREAIFNSNYLSV